MKAKAERNQKIVSLRNSDKKKYTYQKLADQFGLSVITIWEIYHREMFRLSPKRYTAPKTVRSKYVYLQK